MIVCEKNLLNGHKHNLIIDAELTMPMPDLNLNLSDIQFDGTSIDASYFSEFGTDLYSKDYIKNLDNIGIDSAL